MFFFKQKTAYEMRISDWSSDVCSSDLDDDLVVMASEIGVLDIPPEKIVRQWRLQPGKMFLIDLEEGRIVDDGEIKAQLATTHPYREWLNKTQVKLEALPAVGTEGTQARPATNPPRSDVPLLDLQSSEGQRGGTECGSKGRY